jgi:hypothetical protein
MYGRVFIYSGSHLCKVFKLHQVHRQGYLQVPCPWVQENMAFMHVGAIADTVASFAIDIWVTEWAVTC